MRDEGYCGPIVGPFADFPNLTVDWSHRTGSLRLTDDYERNRTSAERFFGTTHALINYRDFRWSPR